MCRTEVSKLKRKDFLVLLLFEVTLWLLALVHVVSSSRMALWAQLTSPAQLCHGVVSFNRANRSRFQNQVGGQASSLLDGNDWIWFTSWLDVSPTEDDVSEARSTSRFKHLGTEFLYSEYLFSCHLAGGVSSLYQPKFSKGISWRWILWHAQMWLHLYNTGVAHEELWFQWSKHCSACFPWPGLAGVPSAFLFSAHMSFMLWSLDYEETMSLNISIFSLPLWRNNGILNEPWS